MSNPFLLFFPYLPITGSYELGPWQIGRLNSYSGPWASPEFETLSKIFLGSFRNTHGDALSNPGLLSHRNSGMAGKLPTKPQRLAIQRSVDFAVLDRNPRPDSDNAGWLTATTDNSELFIWPIDTIGQHIALGRGAIVPVLEGGYTISTDLAVPAPLELHIPWEFGVDADLLKSLYHLFVRRLSGSQDHTRRRVEVAIGWLSKAWRNSTSIRAEDRVVFLKTGFEALTGESENWKCARSLRDLFERELSGVSKHQAEHLLWSPKEKERFTYTYNRGSYQITDLQHWFIEFGTARNTIIHNGVVPKLKYRERRSRFNGPYVMTAERLLREAIMMELRSLGYQDLWISPQIRRIHRAVQALNL